jgi:hypothetical protein
MVGTIPDRILSQFGNVHAILEFYRLTCFFFKFQNFFKKVLCSVLFYITFFLVRSTKASCIVSLCYYLLPFSAVSLLLEVVNIH